MAHIQIVYVKNIISYRRNRPFYQTVSFFMWLDNIDYIKQVDVIWAGSDGIWRNVPARYYGQLDGNKEYWQAKIKCKFSGNRPLPGDIQFSVRYRVLGCEYWDNNQGCNYSSPADSGIKLMGLQVLNIDFISKLQDYQKSMPITVAVDKGFAAKQVIVHWTVDNWKTIQTLACAINKNYWNKLLHNKSKNKLYNIDIWHARINVEHAFKVQYCISCESENHVIWDNNYGYNYSISRKPLLILILNLHCYQEKNQDYKLSQIAKAIQEQQVDIVCLQEVAEYWNNGQGDWKSNAAKIINDRLLKPYYLYTDWSHLGFNQYREGVALLSRYPLLEQESRYVSDSQDPYDIHSRKVVMGQIKLPYFGLINLFSIHLSWWEDGFKKQFENLSSWADSKRNNQVKATLLCGDFNITAGSAGYRLVVDLHQYDDQFLAIKSPELFNKIFKVYDPHWQNYLIDDYRIDFIFMDKVSHLMVKSGDVLFTDQDYGQVSDHCGYLMAFEPK